jgi:hypothetical protein
MKDSPHTPISRTLQSPTSQAKFKLRRKVEKRYTTDCAYKNPHKLPSKEEVDKHVDDEMVLSWVFGMSKWFKDEVWDLVYDHGMRGVGGPDKERFEALCESNNIPVSRRVL